jgi:hypothetical protein
VTVAALGQLLPQHFLYLRPEPHGHGALGLTRVDDLGACTLPRVARTILKPRIASCVSL